MDVNQKTEWVHHENNLIFNRLHYFLISIAFLVTAFAATVTSSRFDANFSNPIFYIALAISIFAFFLSSFFAFLNYFNQLIVQEANKVPEDKLQEYTMKTLFDDALKEARGKFDLIKEFRTFVKNLFSGQLLHGDFHAPYTWFVPISFCIFWDILTLIIIFWASMNLNRQVHWLIIGFICASTAVFGLSVFLFWLINSRYAKKTNGRKKIKFLIISKFKDVALTFPSSLKRQLLESSISVANRQKKEGKLMEFYWVPGADNYIAIGECETAEEMIQNINMVPISSYMSYEIYPLANYIESMKIIVERLKDIEKITPTTPKDIPS